MTKATSVRYPFVVRDLAHLRAELTKAALHGRTGCCGWLCAWLGGRLVRWDEAVGLVNAGQGETGQVG